MKTKKKKTIILASKSPRRIELLHQAGFIVLSFPADLDEESIVRDSPEETVTALALAKANKVRSDILSGEIIIPDDDPNTPIVAADTIVYREGIIGKPESKEDALSILMKLQGTSHTVYTGVAILYRNEKTDISFFEETSVYFKSYTPEELAFYLDTEEPYDKAGAYGIQGYFARYIDHIEGSYSNVMGLPVERLLELL